MGSNGVKGVGLDDANPFMADNILAFVARYTNHQIDLKSSPPEPIHYFAVFRSLLVIIALIALIIGRFYVLPPPSATERALQSLRDENKWSLVGESVRRQVRLITPFWGGIFVLTCIFFGVYTGGWQYLEHNSMPWHGTDRNGKPQTIMPSSRSQYKGEMALVMKFVIASTVLWVGLSTVVTYVKNDSKRLYLSLFFVLALVLQSLVLLKVAFLKNGGYLSGSPLRAGMQAIVNYGIVNMWL